MSECSTEPQAIIKMFMRDMYQWNTHSLWWATALHERSDEVSTQMLKKICLEYFSDGFVLEGLQAEEIAWLDPMRYWFGTPEEDDGYIGVVTEDERTSNHLYFLMEKINGSWKIKRYEEFSIGEELEIDNGVVPGVYTMNAVNRV